MFFLKPTNFSAKKYKYSLNFNICIVAQAKKEAN